jgi:hypothetical protein
MRSLLNRLVAVLALALVVPVSASASTFASGSLPAQSGPDDRNTDAEPSLAASPSGDFWATAFAGNDERRLPTESLANDDVWRSTDGGATYEWVASPFSILGSDTTTLGGDDEDITVASAPNALGNYNVYAATLWAPAGTPAGVVGDISLGVSRDNGRTWLVDPVAAEIPSDDRPWLSADGPCAVYLTYHALPTGATTVNRYDLCHPLKDIAGLSTVPASSTRYVELAPSAVRNAPAQYLLVGFGKPAVDTSPASPYRHRMYIPALDCGKLTVTDEVSRATADCPDGVTGKVVVQIGRHDGTDWKIRPVASSTNGVIPIWATSIDTDSAGNVYLAWFDDHSAYLDVSRDGGRTWSKPVRINPPSVPTAVFPTVAAGASGVVRIAFYGTRADGDAGDVDVMGDAGTQAGAPWRVYQSSSTDRGRTFATGRVSPVVHRGIVCTTGASCDLDARSLFDDFGAAISPTTGRSSIVYTSDQPGGGIERVHADYATETP